jgi:dipeptidyl aminopeptidase/acylaminoacyl peptidase
MVYDAVPLVPRSVLFGNPHRTSPDVSPDGTRFGYVAPDEGVLNVWVGPLDGSREPVPVTHDRGQGIPVFAFAQNDRTLVYLQDADGDENWRVCLLDLETGEERCITPFDNVRAQIRAHNRWNPETLLLTLNKDDPKISDLYRYDLAADRLELMERNPGFTSWILDADLVVRGGASVTSDGGAVFHLRDETTGEFLPWRSIPFDDLAGTDIVCLTRDGRTLLMLTPMGANTRRLLAIDLESDTEKVLAEDPHWDVGRVLLDPETLQPQGVAFAKDRHEWLWLDPAYGAEVERLRASLDVDGEVEIGRSERSGRYWIVVTMPSDGSTRYYVHDRAESTTRLLFAQTPELDDHQLAKMEPFSFTSRDGLDVHGYVTFPPGVERKDLPAVLNVHGGPTSRDYWGYNAEVQWLANRGYVCVQVNFRGSAGYGKAFCSAGDKEWGRKMQDDLLDAVNFCVGQGWVDAARVGIMGASYGGYAALAGAAFTPEVFRCAVDLCGPSSLLTLLASIPPYWKPMLGYMNNKIGNPDTDQEQLWSRSPLSRVSDIRIPVLVAQGANDPRVKQAEAEQIVAALREKGLPHEYLLFEDEGHGLSRPANRERFYSAAERFLAAHLGGRCEE